MDEYLVSGIQVKSDIHAKLRLDLLGGSLSNISATVGLCITESSILDSADLEST